MKKKSTRRFATIWMPHLLNLQDINSNQKIYKKKETYIQTDQTKQTQKDLKISLQISLLNFCHLVKSLIFFLILYFLRKFLVFFLIFSHNIIKKLRPIQRHCPISLNLYWKIKNKFSWLFFKFFKFDASLELFSGYLEIDVFLVIYFNSFHLYLKDLTNKRLLYWIFPIILWNETEK